EMIEMSRRLVELKKAGRIKNDWHIDLYCEAADLKDLDEHIRKIETPVVFDHMAVPNIKNGVEDPEFQRYLKLFRDKTNCYAKVTCPERITMSGNPEDWNKVAPYVNALTAEFPDRVLLGTDWPHPNMKEGQMPNDGKLVNRWMREIVARGDD